MKHYKVIHSVFIEDLEKRVNEFLNKNKDWKVAGGIAIIVRGDGTIGKVSFLQAVIHKKKG